MKARRRLTLVKSSAAKAIVHAEQVRSGQLGEFAMEAFMIKPKKLLLALTLLLFAGVTAICSNGIPPAQADDSVTVKLGVVTSLSPPGDYQLGQAAKEAAESFVKWNNAQNNGVTFDLVGVIDDKGDPATGQAGVRRLLAQGAQAFVGDMSSAILTAELPLVQQGNAMYVIGGSWANDLTGPSKPLVFRVGAYNNALAINGIVPYLKKLKEAKGVTRVAALAEDSAFGTDIAKVLKEQIAKDVPGMTLDVEVFPANSNDVTPQLLAIKKNDPQVLIILSVTPAENLAINQAHEVGLVPPADILASYDYPEYSDYWGVVKENGVGVYYLKQEAPNTPLNDMGKHFSDTVGHRPTIWAMWVWDACLSLQQAALKAKSADATAMAKALEEASFVGATGPIS